MTHTREYFTHMHTIPEAAAMLGLSPQTLRLQARIGKLRAVKIGREWVVRPEEVERYRREHRRPIEDVPA